MISQILIHSWLVSMIKESSWYVVAMDFFTGLNLYDLFNQYCSNFLNKLMVRRLRIVPTPATFM